MKLKRMKLLKIKFYLTYQKISANISYPNENYWGVEVNTPINSGKGKIEYIKDYKLTNPSLNIKAVT